MVCINEESGNNGLKFQMTKNKSQINFNIQIKTYGLFKYCDLYFI
jgi:hypothetical protein